MAMNRSVLRTRRKKAIDCARQGRFEEARKLLSAVCRAEPRDAEALCLLGAVSGQLGDYERALDCCRKATLLQPDYAEAWYNLAQACMHCNRFGEAANAYRKVVGLAPDYADAHFNLGFALEQTGDYEAAARSYRKAIDIRPDHVEAYCNLGNLLNNLAQGSREEGINYLRVAVRLAPRNPQARLYLGRALTQAGRIDEALEHYGTILEHAPHDTEAIAAMAVALEKQGDFDQALALLSPHLDKADGHIANAFSLVAPHFDRAPEAIELLDRALRAGSLEREDSRTLHFRLGALLDKAGDYGRAFEHFRQANAIKRSDYEPRETLAQFDEIEAFFEASRLAGLPRSGNDSTLPIFIVGMPRSGTTLVEQILDSHPDVHGAGELVLLEETLRTVTAHSRSRHGYPACLEDASESALAAAAASHLEKLREYAPQASRIVDKMPHNFKYLGLIELLFPSARVIHCRRHPMDTCLSIYTYDFNARHGYATELEWLGQYYRRYLALMEHWKQVLHIPLLDISYEDMIEDQEGTTRRLIDFCDLPWDERCLDFHKNRRSVNTISYDQVRRPIYRKSVARWRHYETELEPLRRALEADSE